MTSQQRRDRLFEEPTPRQQRHQSLLYRFVRPILRAPVSYTHLTLPTNSRV